MCYKLVNNIVAINDTRLQENRLKSDIHYYHAPFCRTLCTCIDKNHSSPARIASLQIPCQPSLLTPSKPNWLNTISNFSCFYSSLYNHLTFSFVSLLITCASCEKALTSSRWPMISFDKSNWPGCARNHKLTQ